MNVNGQTAEFRLVGSALSPLVPLGLILAGALPLIGVILTGGGTVGVGVVAGIASCSLMAGLVLWAISANGKGTAMLSADGLTLDRISGKETYPWEHIAAIQPSERVAVLSSINKPVTNVSVLRVDLTRPRRLSLVPLRGGTNVFGVPSLVKSILVRVDDPEGFLTRARTFMPQTPDLQG